MTIITGPSQARKLLVNNWHAIEPNEECQGGTHERLTAPSCQSWSVMAATVMTTAVMASTVVASAMMTTEYLVKEAAAMMSGAVMAEMTAAMMAEGMVQAQVDTEASPIVTPVIIRGGVNNDRIALDVNRLTLDVNRCGRRGADYLLDGRSGPGFDWRARYRSWLADGLLGF